MTNVLSVYLSDHHSLDSSTDYIRRLDPAWIRIHQPTARAIWRAQQAAPNAKIMLRSWDIDDHNGDRKSEAYADPRGAANKHLMMWDELIRGLRAEFEENGWRYDETKWHLGLINEPDPAHLPQIVEYTRARMEMTAWPLGVMVPSVGNFGIPGKDPNDWSLVKPLEKAILDGGHIVMAHEYWQPEGPTCVWTDQVGNRRSDAGYLAWRHRYIPLDVPILIGESGANGFIYNRHSDKDDAGWGRFMSPEQYAAQVREYIAGCDTRVQGVCLYMTDYHSDQWRTFDTTPAHEQLLAIRETRPAGQTPHTVHVPVVVVDTPAGDDFRRAVEWVLRWEGEGPVIDSNGAWTKWGINQAANPRIDVRNLTREQAIEIYRQGYWLASGADKLSWPLCLVHFNAAVNAGVYRAGEFLKAANNAPDYIANQLDWYTRIDGWQQYGGAWTRRMADLVREL